MYREALKDGLNWYAEILVLTESEASSSLFAELLSPLNATLSTVRTSSEAVELSQLRSFDCVLIDFDVPSLGDLNLLQRLKESPLNRGIPVILIGSFDTDHQIDRAFAAGAADYIPRTKIRSRLQKIVHKILKQRYFKNGKTILIVDDCESILGQISACLEEAGFQTITANNSPEAISILEQKSIDLIISDIQLPGMSGTELYTEIRRKEKLRTIPFIVMSGTFGLGRMRRMIQMGAAAFITKPFQNDQLVSLAERLLSDHFLLMLKNKEMADAERKHLIDSISSLANALEARDFYTRGHSKNVARILMGMGEAMELDQEEVDLLRICGELHDVGKIGVRDSVLQKPGPLTEAEFEEIKQHPIIGSRIIESITSLQPVQAVVLQHHERFDGGGYPEGRSGENIAFYARMTAVADTFDALTSDRSYRKGMNVERALRIMGTESGKQLCPEALEFFLKWYEKKGEESKQVNTETSIA